MASNISIDRHVGMKAGMPRADAYFLKAVTAVLLVSALAPVWSFVAWMWLKGF